MGEDGSIAKIEGSGYFVNAHMADISMRAKLRGLKNANGDPLFKSDMQSGTNYFLDGSPMNFPNNGSFDKSKALMISGDFSQLAYSIRQDITFKLLQRVLSRIVTAPLHTTLCRMIWLRSELL